jgi:hypothetical protein
MSTSLNSIRTVFRINAYDSVEPVKGVCRSGHTPKLLLYVYTTEPTKRNPALLTNTINLCQNGYKFIAATQLLSILLMISDNVQATDDGRGCTNNRSMSPSRTANFKKSNVVKILKWHYFKSRLWSVGKMNPQIASSIPPFKRRW